MRRFLTVLVIVAAYCMCARPGYAQTPAQVFTITDGKKTAFCGWANGKFVPVVKVKVDGVEIYRTLTEELRSVKKQAKTKPALAKKVTTLTALQSRTKSTCAKGPTNQGPVSPTPTATATPSGSSPVGCFDRGGNTQPGCFEIPSPLIGNLDRGEDYFLSFCTGCHASRPAYGYTRVTGAFGRIPQMAPFRPNDQTIADIVAYLNRFNF